MQEDEVNAGFFKAVEAFGDLLGCADKAGAETTVRDRIVFKGNPLFQLRAGQPLLVIRITSGRLLDIRDAAEFVLGFAFGFADDGVTGDAEF